MYMDSMCKDADATQIRFPMRNLESGSSHRVPGQPAMLDFD